METIHIGLDMVQTAGVGALALIIGMWLTRKVTFLQRFCVPSPVSGGIIFSLLTLCLWMLTRRCLDWNQTKQALVDARSV